MPGRHQDQGGVGERGDLELGLARRRRSRSARRRSRPRRARAAPAGVDQASPPRWPREAIDRMKTPLSLAWSCIRTRSPSSAPPENGDEGSTASTPTRLPSARSARTSAAVVVDLPTPGDPVSPRTCACPVCGASAAATSRSAGLASSTSEISRATERASPSRARSTSAGTSAARRPRRPPWTAGAAVWTAVPSVASVNERARAGSGRRPDRRRRTARRRPHRPRGDRARAPCAGRCGPRSSRSGGPARSRRR